MKTRIKKVPFAEFADIAATMNDADITSTQDNRSQLVTYFNKGVPFAIEFYGVSGKPKPMEVFVDMVTIREIQGV